MWRGLFSEFYGIRSMKKRLGISQLSSSNARHMVLGRNNAPSVHLNA